MPLATPSAACETGGPFAFGVGIDCTIELDARLGDERLYAAGLIDQNGEYWPCDVEPGVLRCRDIGKERYDLATRTLDLELDHEVEGFLRFDDVAVVETTVDRQPRLVTIIDSFEPVVFDGRPLPVELFATVDLERAFIVVRERDSGERIDTIEVTAPGRDRSVSARIRIDAEPGRYRLWPCLGADEATCELQPAGFPVQVIDPEIRELIPGRNRPSAERINVVFAGSQVGSADDLVAMATTMLTIEGPQAGPYAFAHGPMAIEPLASNQHRFNFWYLVDQLADERSLLVDGTDPNALEGFDLDNMAVTVLYGPGYGASDARITSLWNETTVPPAAAIRFGGARVSVDVDDPLASATTLAHEWGHSLFELRDEYVGFDDRGVLTQYPNCAPSAALAEQWWGSLDGSIDPFVYEVLRARRAAGFPGEPRDGENLADRVRIGVFSGGCYDAADVTTAYRPSSDSLMNSEIPVWGSVNRRRVQQVLARFSGRGPLDDLEAVDLTCERDDVRVRCLGVLDRFLDPPGQAVTLEAATCDVSRPLEPTSVTDRGLATIRCETPSAAGSVVLALGQQRRIIPVRDVPQPEPVVDPATAEGEPSAPVGEPGDGSWRLPLALGGGLAVFVLVRVGRAAWRRQK